MLLRKISWCAPLAALALLGACTSVDLNQGRYNPPPVRMPGQTQAAGQAPVAAQPQPIGAQSTPVGTAPDSVQSLPPLDGGQGVAMPVQPVQPVQPVAPGEDPRVALTTDMTGASAVPVTPSYGSGHIDMVFNRETNVLRWKTTWGGLEGAITGVQFHGPADAGQTAPAAMIWPGPFGATYEGRATLSAEHAAELLRGLWYVNVQTSAYPHGEIRGQLRVVE